MDMTPLPRIPSFCEDGETVDLLYNTYNHNKLKPQSNTTKILPYYIIAHFFFGSCR